LASIDLAYSFSISKETTLKLYAEGTAEDQNVILPFQFSRLLGATIYSSHGDQGNSWRATFEYSDTADTLVWIFGKRQFNVMYNHGIYQSGYKYKQMPIGHSLFNDSRLFTLSLTYNASNNWMYNLKLHNAFINMDGLSTEYKANQSPIHKLANHVNIIEATISKEFSAHQIKLNIQYMNTKFVLPHTPINNFNIQLSWKFNLNL
jgi:hypothetical protein